MQAARDRLYRCGILLTAIVCITIVSGGCRSSTPTGPRTNASAPAHPPPGTNLTAEAAIARLKAGNERFRSGGLRHPDQSLRRLHEVESSQHPFAVIVSCSDSRVPPEIVFDEGLGDLFVVREAGHVGGAATLGSVEYAVEHLHVRLVVVMGHENCGAVSAAAEVIVKNTRPEGHIISLVDAIRPAVERARRGPEAGLVSRAVEANVDLVVSELRESHPILSEHLADGSVKIVGAVYNLHSGTVEWR
jgi:carbonic anhydrase